jgi:hypothetical protein
MGSLYATGTIVHSRKTKEREREREREREEEKKRTRVRESTSFFVYRQTPVEAGKSEKKNIWQIYAPACSCSVY